MTHPHRDSIENLGRRLVAKLFRLKEDSEHLHREGVYAKHSDPGGVQSVTQSNSLLFPASASFRAALPHLLKLRLLWEQL
jgi:hypothetical protein